MSVPAAAGAMRQRPWFASPRSAEGASGQQPASAPPFSARCRAMRFHVRGVDHLCVCGSSVSSKLPEQVFPDATPRPAHKAIIDRCRRSILGRAIAPATAAFQNMHDTADDAAVVRPLDAPYIRRQMRFDPSPLLVAQPKQVPAHNPDPLPKTNQDRIVRAKKLMSSDPRPRENSPCAWRGRLRRLRGNHPTGAGGCSNGPRARWRPRGSRLRCR